MEVLLWDRKVSDYGKGTDSSNLSYSFPEPFECEILPRNESVVELILQASEDE